MMNLQLEQNKAKQLVVLNGNSLQKDFFSKTLSKKYSVRSYSNSEQALRAMHGQVPPDLIIIDLHMPDIDGWRFSRLLRSPEFSAFNGVPIIIFSDIWKGEAPANISEDLGASAFVPVPVKESELLSNVEHVLEGKIIATVPKVLIIDDDESNNMVVKHIFEKEGYQAVTFLCANDGLTELGANHFDLALLDYHLPDMKGTDLLKECRQLRPETVCVMITADPDPKLAFEFLQAGAAAYVQRPFNRDYLLRVCKNARRERTLLRAEAMFESRTKELQETKTELVEKNLMLEGILDSFPEILSVKKPDLSVVRYNRNGHVMFNMEENQVKGKKCYDLIGRKVPCQSCPTLKALETGKQENIERYFPELGKYMSCKSSPVFGEDGGIIYLVELIQDITTQKDFEAELIKSREQAEAASIAKSQFLANMSHELLTPFNGIMGMMQLLQTTQLNNEQHQYIEAALKSSQRFIRLLKDVLDLASIEAGKVTLASKSLDTEELLESIYVLFSAKAMQKGIDFPYVMDPDVPALIAGDIKRLKQVFFNLVGNALKYTDQGKVDIRLSRLSAAKGGDLRLMFSVSDTGTGIPDNRLNEIFSPFVQADGSLTRKHQGAGIGLTLVKQLVDMMGGDISVESKVHVGTTVHVVIPFTLPADEHSGLSIDGIPHRGSKSYLDILLVEDEEMNVLLMGSILKKLGHSVTLAKNGKEAVDLFQDKDFDCILMDIQMPVMNGVEATKRIRRLEKENAGILASWDTGIEKSGVKTGMPGQAEQSEAVPGSETQAFQHSRIPIIAVTAHSQRGDREKFLKAGMDGYIDKPVSMDVLKKKLEKVQRIRWH